jgi:ribosomal protein S12 methylthiotransferase accessory factor
MVRAPNDHPQQIVRCLSEYQKLSPNWAHPLTGIVSLLITEPPDPSSFKFVWTSQASLRSNRFAKNASLKATGFGAGLSAGEATNKAVSEALELHAAGICCEDEVLSSSASALTGDFLDPRAVSLYDQAQYRNPSFRFDRFYSRSRIAWTRGQWLDTGADVWLPVFLTHFGARAALNQSFAQVTTSGLATGTSLFDASMHAICELVERDAFMITWLAQLPSGRLIPDSLDEATRRTIGQFEASGLEIRTYLLKAGIDIPVVLSVVHGDGKNWPGATVGLGAHADPVTATRSAILEQALMGPALRQQMLEHRLRIPRRASQVETPLDHALFYVPRGRARAFDFLDSGKIAPVMLSELARPKRITLDLYKTRLADASVRVAIKNLTPPAVATGNNLCVVRAVGTNLQSLHFGFGLTRSATKRLKTAIRRKELNSSPHPLG